MHGTIERKSPHWAVCQILSHRAPRVREEIEKIGHGTFIPTYVKVWFVGGRKFAQERPLMPGSLPFVTEPDGWSDVNEVEGVFSVLANQGVASRITEEEMHRLVVDHATGRHNAIMSRADRRYSKRRRRPRPGKRLRAANDRA